MTRDENNRVLSASSSNSAYDPLCFHPVHESRTMKDSAMKDSAIGTTAAWKSTLSSPTITQMKQCSFSFCIQLWLIL